MIRALMAYWGEITNGSEVWVVGAHGIRKGTVVAMRSTIMWPVFSVTAGFRDPPVVDLDLGSDERMLSVPLAELYPTQWEAQHAYTKTMIREIVREELAKQKENTNG